MPKRRRISSVIDQLLEVIPKNEQELIDKLNCTKSECSYKAPEQEGPYWYDISTFIYNYFNKVPPEKLVEDWKKRVFNIWMNKN